MHWPALALTCTCTCGASMFACASTPAPSGRYATSQAAIRAAEELDAQATPAARLHLELAKDQLATAKTMMANGKHERAELVLMRAESDADVAVSIAKEAEVRKRSQAAREVLRKSKIADSPDLPADSSQDIER